MIGRANPLASYSSVHSLSKNSLGLFNNRSSYNNSMTSAISERLNESKRSERDIRNQKLREKIRGLTTEPLKNNNPYSATVSGKANGYLDLTSTYEKKAKSMASSYKYNYKDVSTRIQRAKTSVSAGQAVIAAKRKVVEIKRKEGESLNVPFDIQTIRKEVNNISLSDLTNSPIASTGYYSVTFTDYILKLFSSISPAYEQTIDELMFSQGADTVSVLMRCAWIPKFPFVYVKRYIKTVIDPYNGPLSKAKKSLKYKIKDSM